VKLSQVTDVTHTTLGYILSAPNNVVPAYEAVQESHQTEALSPNLRVPEEEAACQILVPNLNALVLIDEEHKHVTIRGVETTRLGDLRIRSTEDARWVGERLLPASVISLLPKPANDVRVPDPTVALRGPRLDVLTLSEDLSHILSNSGDAMIEVAGHKVGGEVAQVASRGRSTGAHLAERPVGEIILLVAAVHNDDVIVLGLHDTPVTHPGELLHGCITHLVGELLESHQIPKALIVRSIGPLAVGVHQISHFMFLSWSLMSSLTLCPLMPLSLASLA
jgi:hypothetical protein